MTKTADLEHAVRKAKSWADAKQRQVDKPNDLSQWIAAQAWVDYYAARRALQEHQEGDS